VAFYDMHRMWGSGIVSLFPDTSRKTKLL